jgi:DNA-directed RNA polymerase II subunit RPB1
MNQSTAHVKKIKRFQFGVMSPEVIAKRSACQIFQQDIYNHSNHNQPVNGGLADIRMGARHGITCATCHHNLDKCTGHHGYINLGEHRAYYPHFIEYIVSILPSVCFSCSRLLVDAVPQEIRAIPNRITRGRAVKTYIARKNKQAKGIPRLCPHCGDKQPLKYKHTYLYIYITIKEEYFAIKDGALDTLRNAIATVENCTVKAEQKEFTIDEVVSLVENNAVSINANDVPTLWERLSRESTVVLTANNCYEILEAISDEDVSILGFSPQYSRPEWMIISNMLVPPPAIRPSVVHDITNRSEGDLTHKLFEVIKKCNQVNHIIAQGEQSSNSNLSFIGDYLETRDCHITTFYNNDIKGVPIAHHRNNRPTKDLMSVFGKKEGRIRNSLVGKRVDFAARSVVTPDPSIELDELGVPRRMACKLTVPVVVNNYNRASLRDLILTGEDGYPGAKYIYIRPIDGGSPRRIHLKFRRRLRSDPPLRETPNGTVLASREELFEALKPGDVVERHLTDGDTVMFNRQPSLHKMSMMCHKVRVMEHETFRLNEICTSPYNADFDGDEMNMHCAQSEETAAELYMLTSVPTQIVSPQSNKPVIGAIQDTLLFSYLITRGDCWLKRYEVEAMMAMLPGDDPHSFPCEGDDPVRVTAERLDVRDDNGDVLYNGRLVFSLALPLNLNYRNGDPEHGGVLIRDGLLVTGVANKKIVGTAAGGLVHYLWIYYSPTIVKCFLHYIQLFATRFFYNRGFSIGLRDMLTTEAIDTQVLRHIKDASDTVMKLEGKRYNTKTPAGWSVRKGGSVQEHNKTDFRAIFENKCVNALNEARDDAGSYTSKTLTNDNAFLNMVNAGSKGSLVNISQVMACVGQQAMNYCHKTGRVPYWLDGRSLVHFPKYDDSAEARGFVKNSFITGLTPSEFFYHAMSGREGVIDTAVKTATTGYLQRRFVRVMENLVVQYDGTVRNAQNKIVQFVYGMDGFSGEFIEKQNIPLITVDRGEFRERYCWPALKAGSALKAEATTLATLRRRYRSDAYISLQGGVRTPIVAKNIIGQVRKEKSESSNWTAEQCATILGAFVKNIKSLTPHYERLSHRGKHFFGLFRLAFYSAFSSKRVFREWKLTRTELEEALVLVRKRLIASLAQPGDAVGVIAGQSIGEPSTQMTLNTFHSAGVSSNNKVSLGVPRLEEIITLGKKPKEPSSTIYLREKRSSKEHARKVMEHIVHTSFAQFIECTEIFHELDDDVFEEYLRWMDLDDDTDDRSHWTMRIRINRDELFRKRMSMEEIYWSIIRDPVIVLNDVVVLYTHDNSSQPAFYFMVSDKLAPKGIYSIYEDGPFSLLKKVENALLSKVICGVPDIKSASLRSVSYKHYNKTRDVVENKQQWVIDTEGSNLLGIFQLPFVAKEQTVSNNIREIAEMFGIEAARESILQEIQQVMSFNGIYIDQRHIGLVADQMTHKGILTSVTRFGMKVTEASPLTRAAFESTDSILCNSAARSSVDMMTGATPNIMVGQTGRIGTCFADYQVDLDAYM